MIAQRKAIHNWKESSLGICGVKFHADSADFIEVKIKKQVKLFFHQVCDRN